MPTQPTTRVDLLAEGIDAARAGERGKAREKLTRLLRQDQKNEQAWLWMSSVVESDRERIYCLNNALKLNPNSKTAKRGLALLGALPPELRADLDIEIVGVTMEADEKPKPPAKRRVTFRRSRRLENVLIGGVALLLIGVIGLFIANFVIERIRLASIVPPTPIPPTAAPTLAPTLTPTPTPEIRTATPIANLTPLAQLLNLSFTPTPPPFTLPFFPEESYSRGESAYNAGDYDTATRLFKDALSQNPKNYSAHYYLGEIYLKNEDYNKAFNEFSTALRLNPNFAPGHLGHGQANFELGGNPLGDYDKARAADSQWVEPYIQSAIFYASRRKADAAINELEAGRSLAPTNVVVMWRLAEQYLAVGRYDDARAVLDLGNEIDPSVLDLYRVRAKLALALEDYSDAQEAVNTYTAYQSDDAEGWTLAGEAYLGLGDPATALTHLDRAVGLKPLDSREALIARGEAQLLLGNADVARSDFDKALALGITTRFRVSIGRAYYLAGDFETAIAELEKAVESDPTVFDPSYWLGAAQVGAKRYADAIRPLTDAFSNAGSDQQTFDALYQRALAYNGAGQTENALADLQTALALNVSKRATQQTEALILLKQLGGSPAPTHTPTVTP